MSEIVKSYVGDIGTRIRITLNTSIAGLSTQQFFIKKPSGAIVTKTAVVEDASDGILYYDTISGDFNEIGKYMVQAKLTFASGNIFKTKTNDFIVYEEFH